MRAAATPHKRPPQRCHTGKNESEAAPRANGIRPLTHSSDLSREGLGMKPTRNFPLTPERIDRFWSYVDRRGPNECWEWTGEKHNHGYGIYSEWGGGGTVEARTGGSHRTVKCYAHRLSVRIDGRSIEGKVVRHDCDNPPCVNPAHLRTGTQADNIRDAVERGRMDLSGLAVPRRGFERAERECAADGCAERLVGGRNYYCRPCAHKRARALERARYHRDRQLRQLGSTTPKERARIRAAQERIEEEAS